MIIIPARNIVESDPAHIPMGLEGWYSLRAIRGGRVVREIEFPTKNLITDLGLDRIGSESTANTYRYCHVGTGTTPPAPLDTQLANYLASVSASSTTENGNSGTPDFYSWRRFTWVSNIGALGNNILTEIGVSGSTASGLLFSRDLIKDSAGNPSTFPISSDEQLAATYELRLYPPLGDVEAEVQIGSNTHDTITRAAVANSAQWGILTNTGSNVNFQASSSAGLTQVYEGDIGSITGLPGGRTVNATSGTIDTLPYVNGSHYRDMSAGWSPATGAISVRSATFAFNCCRFQVQYDPPIPKQANEFLTLRQRVSWGRL